MRSEFRKHHQDSLVIRNSFTEKYMNRKELIGKDKNE